MTESLHLYLNNSTSVLRRERGWPWKRTIEQLDKVPWQAHDPSSLNLRLPPGGVRRGTCLHVLLGAALCKFLVLDIPAEVVNPAERTLVAVASMREQFGLAAEEWECTVDARSSAGQATVCAVRIMVIDRLRTLAAAHGLKLASVRPYAGVLWDVARAQRCNSAETGLLAVEDDAFTVVMARSGRIVALHALQHQGEAALVERELRRIGLSTGPTMREAMWIALPGHMAGSFNFDSGRLLRNVQDGRAGLTATFQDLLLAAEEAA